MRKKFKLCREYLKSVRANSIALFLILSLSFTMVALLLGRYNYTYARYARLRSMDTECAYFVRPLVKNSERQEINAILGSDPAVGDFVMSSVRYTSTHDEERTDLYFVEEVYCDIFGIDTFIGGFDYSDNGIEVILPFKCIGEYRIGDTFKIVFEEAIKEVVEKDDKESWGDNIVQVIEKDDEHVILVRDLVVETRVCGFSSPNALYASMSGGATKPEADDIFGELDDFVLVKYNEKARDAFAVVEKSNNTNIGFACMITFADAATPAQKDELVEKLSDHGMISTVDDILENSKASINEDIADFIPFSVFLTAFALVTLVSIIALSVYRQASDYAVWYLVGADRRKIVSVVVSSFMVITVLAALTSSALLLVSVLPKVVEKLDFLESVLVDFKLLALELILIAITITITAVVCRLAVKDNDPRKMMDKYRD